MFYRDYAGGLGAGYGGIVAAGLTPRRRRRKALDDPFLSPWAGRADETAPDPFDDVLAPQPPDRPSAPKKRAKREADDPFVSDLRQAWQRGGRPLTRHRDGLALKGAVGPDAANRRHDLARVEALLGGAGALDVTATEGPTGYFGRRTDAAIRKLQRDRRLKVDGLITPKGPTLATLMQSLPRAPVPAFAVPKTPGTVGRDARAANGRLVDAVMKTRGAGIVPKLLADAVAQGPSGEAEVADFFAQLAERDTTRARDMATLVAAERARPDLPEEGGEQPEGGEGETPPKGPDKSPPDGSKEDPLPRRKGNPCFAYALDVKDALNAHAAKRRELREVEIEIDDNDRELEKLRAVRDETEAALTASIPTGEVSGAGGKGLGKAAGKVAPGAALLWHWVLYQARKDRPNRATVWSDIAALEARQAELRAMQAKLRPEVDGLWQQALSLEAKYQACLAEHDYNPEPTDPEPDDAGPVPTV